MGRYASWGNYPRARQRVRSFPWRAENLPVPDDGETMLPHGLGRSYGDSCLNDGGTLLDTTELNHFIRFDHAEGLVRCEAGVSLATILELALPRGWFLPVTPGTKFVTVGGAIANDVHGKNHHRAGTFGCFVTRFELLRSDGQRLECSPDRNAALFRATVGGLGLTGLITWAEFRLKAVESGFIDHESIRFDHLDEFFELADASDAAFEHTVAWVDCMARGRNLGRGLFMRGNHAGPGNLREPRQRQVNIPFNAPGLLLNPWSIRAFNALYYNKQRRKIVGGTQHYGPFFYPLDSVHNWNRLYGKRGFLQYQCLMPPAAGIEGARKLFTRIAESGEGSFLAVLKNFGDRASPGMLSFPRPGITLALDFANRGRRTFDLLDDLDALVREYGGRVYPAKDARMSADSFQAYFPEWEEFARHVDPAFSSSFWRRVTPATSPRGD